MSQPFWLMAKSRWRGFTLKQEGKEELDFDSIADALTYARTLPDSSGTLFIVFDEQGKEMARLTV